MGLWVSCANGAPWEKGKAPHSVCADGQSLVSGGVGSSRTSSAFSSLQRAQWKTVKQWDFCDCNLNTCNLKKKNLLPVNSVRNFPGGKHGIGLVLCTFWWFWVKGQLLMTPQHCKGQRVPAAPAPKEPGSIPSLHELVAPGALS